MVGFGEVERLAHQLEAYLSGLRKNEFQLDRAGVETLVEAVAGLERVIAARRGSTVTPNIAGLIDAVSRLLANVSSAGHNDPSVQRVVAINDEKKVERPSPAAIDSPAKTLRLTFEPSAELVARGVDVNFVRAKLRELGRIVSSEPVIKATGKIAFTFVLETDVANIEEQLHIDGLVLEPWQGRATSSIKVASRPVASTAESSTHLTPGNIVRVDLQRLDELMQVVGELVLSRARLNEGLGRLQRVVSKGELRSLEETSSAIERQLRDLREGVMRVRMVSVREVFARMQFVVRDLVRELGKQATLHFSGEETQIDKYIVERIMDPLLHLVRNAVSHGLESAAERTAAGKPLQGRIDLRAKTTGETVIIEVEDDGRGIDGSAVLARANALGIETPIVGNEMQTLLDVLCVPGFSTRDHADLTSGRGVGMDVVRRVVEEMGGTIALDTARGRGTRFVIQLPLTLAITDALVVKVADQRYAVPQVAVREVLHSEWEQTRQIENNELLQFHGGVLPLFRMSRFCGLQSAAGPFYALVIGEGTQAMGLVVDRVLGLREIVVRPLTDRLVKVPGIVGATELGDGQVVLILDAANLLRLARNTSEGRMPTRFEPAEAN
jgi:two-component system chemotaxis sensor kinase CheA